MQPSGAKIDIEQLRHDIPKFNALSDGDRQWWPRYLEDVEKKALEAQQSLVPPGLLKSCLR